MSVGKKNPYVFTIGFDKKNPEHLEVVEILNGTEKKAALIAEAVLQYMGKKSAEDTGVSQESIQAMVRLLVRQEMERIAGEVPVSDIGTLTSQQLQPETEKKPAETVIEDLNEEGPPIDERTMQDIAEAMAAFRNM